MKKYIGIAIAVVVFVTQLSLVHGAGMTWDEPASFFIGRVNLQFWRTLDWTNIIDYTNVKRYADSPMRYVAGEEFYPPFPFLVSSAFSYVLAESLHLMPVIDAHHLGEIFIGAIGVAAFYGLATEIGLTTAVSAGITLIYALYPTIFGQMRSDAKDIPLMSMLTISVYLFLRFIRAWRTRGRPGLSWGWAFVWAISFGLAEATKPSAAIIIPILGIWLGLTILISKTWRKSMGALPFFVFTLITFGLLSVAVFYLAWPYLWDNPVPKLTYILGFFRTVGYHMPVLYLGNIYHAGIDLPASYPYAILLYQTPIEITAAAVIGAIVSLWMVIRKRKVLYLLPLLWFFLGIGRFLLPQFLIYAKVRHFIDAMPAFFLLVGIGIQGLAALLSPALRLPHVLGASVKQQNVLTRVVHYLRNGASSHMSPRAVLITAIMTFMIVHEVIISVQFYPYEPSYFNFLVGGSKTVAQKQLFDIEYWGAGTREAMDFINSQGTGPVTVYSCLMRHLTIYYNHPNVIMLPNHPEYAVYNLVPNSPSWFSAMLSYSKDAQTRVYTVKRAGADLFYVYKNTSGSGWRCGYETPTSYDIQKN